MYYLSVFFALIAPIVFIGNLIIMYQEAKERKQRMYDKWEGKKSSDISSGLP